MVYPFLVPLGLQPLNALMLANIQSLGYDFIQGLMARELRLLRATAGVLFIAMRATRRPRCARRPPVRSRRRPGGISEPSLYGIHLRFKKIYPRMLKACRWSDDRHPRLAGSAAFRTSAACVHLAAADDPRLLPDVGVRDRDGRGVRRRDDAHHHHRLPHAEQKEESRLAREAEEREHRPAPGTATATPPPVVAMAPTAPRRPLPRLRCWTPRPPPSWGPRAAGQVVILDAGLEDEGLRLPCAR